jgi:cold shock CspA family protein
MQQEIPMTLSVKASASGESLGGRSRTMLNGTVKWLNRDIGTGFIRTDAGANVLFLYSILQDSNPRLIREGTRVCLDILISQCGLMAINVRAAETQNENT